MVFFTSTKLTTLALAGLLSLSSVSATDASVYLDETVTAAQKLIDTWYSNDTGLFEHMNWNTGAMLTQLADLQCYRPNATTPTVPFLLSNTFTKAGGKGFLDGFYDDEGWWALAWIAAYDLTKDQKYLQQAANIWWDMKGGWQNTTCGGGLWWDKAHKHINSIENVLFLSVSAHMANRVTDQKNKTMYIDWAHTEWDWFTKSGLYNVSGTQPIKDGLNITTCEPGWQAYTYQQGVAIGGLLELNVASPSPDLMPNATAIGTTTVTVPKFMNANGIFLEPVRDYDNDTAQFKGIFSRNLRLLNRKVPKQLYVDFATKNADSIWAKARNAEGLIAPQWDNNTKPAWASSHSSGMAGLLAAGAMLGDNNSKPIPVTKRWFKFRA